MSKRVLILAAHPDDEVIGCGGTIARHAAMGDEVSVLYYADGESSRAITFDEAIAKRREAAKHACSTLGINKAYFLKFLDNRLDHFPLLDLIKPLEEVISEFQPDIVYTHHQGDLNIDHQLVTRAALTACRPLGENLVSEIYAYEVVSSTEWSPLTPFIPNYFVDISNYFDQKLAALRCYESEMREHPHPRSLHNIDALSIYRGASAGVCRAEAFMLLRKICKA